MTELKPCPNGNSDNQRDNWNTRTAPKLPEGYEIREEGRALWRADGLVAYRDLLTGKLGLDLVETKEDERALAIWLLGTRRDASQ